MVVKLKSNAENMTVDPYDRKRATSRRANRRKPIKSKVNIYTHFKKGEGVENAVVILSVFCKGPM